MKRFVLILFLFILIATGVYFFKKTNSNPNVQTTKLSVVTTLFPLFDMAKHIGGASVDVTLLLPPGVEAHSFEPKPSDVERVTNADIFIYTGKYMEPWVEDLLKGINNPNLLVIDASKNVPMITAMSHDADEPPGSLDPHIWLDFANDQIIVREITDAFLQKNSGQTLSYQTNAQAYSETLTALDTTYKESLSTCRKKDVIFGGHFAFGYLTRRYNLTYRAAQGMSPDSEPTARDLIDLVDQIRKNAIDTVYFEELTSPKIAETLARETDTKLLLLNAGHNITKNDFDTGKTFFAIMEENLTNLKEGLHCE